MSASDTHTLAGLGIDPEALTARQRTVSLGAVMAHMLGVGLTLGLLFPLTSLSLEAWGSAGWVIGLAGAMAPVAILVFMPVLPRVAARFGAIRSMILGCSIGAAGLLAMYALPSAPVWIAARLLIGAGLALPWLAGDVWINAVAREESRGQVIAGYVACLFIGFSLGPVALEAVGIRGFAPFALAFSALALAVLPLVAARRLAPPIVAEKSGDVLTAARAVPLMATGAFTAGLTEACIFALLTIWGLERGLGEDGALRLLTVCILGGVILQFAAGSAADKVGRQWLLGAIGVALVFVGAVLQAASGLVVFVAAFVLGGLILALYGLSLTLLGERFPAAQLASASAAFLILYQLGSMVGPVATGIAMDVAGSPGFVAAPVLAGAVVAMVALFGRAAVVKEKGEASAPHPRPGPAA